MATALIEIPNFSFKYVGPALDTLLTVYVLSLLPEVAKARHKQKVTAYMAAHRPHHAHGHAQVEGYPQ